MARMACTFAELQGYPEHLSVQWCPGVQWGGPSVQCSCLAGSQLVVGARIPKRSARG